MRTPAFGRAKTRIRRTCRQAVDWSKSALRTAYTSVTRPFRSSASDSTWKRVWLAHDRARWRRGTETVDCFRFHDGFVATVDYVDRDVTWQLTAGPVPLAGALFTAGLYMQHGITPQIDSEGRMFIAIGDDGPTQVFSESSDTPVEYVYLDVFRTIEELPDQIDTEIIEVPYQRLSRDYRHELPSG